MEENLGEYQPVAIRTFTARQQEETAENRYWSQFKAPVVSREVSISSSAQRLPVQVPVLNLLE